MSTEMAVLEVRQKHIEEQIKQVGTTQTEIFEALNGLRDLVVEVRSRVNSITGCPRPGACDKLESELLKLRDKVQHHEDTFNKMNGASKVIWGLWVVGSFASGIGVTILLKFLFK